MLPASAVNHAEFAQSSPLRNGDSVQPSEGGSQAARDAVRDRMRQLGLGSARALVLESGAGYNSVNEWLRGVRRWPRRETRAKIELALRWEPGELARIAHDVDMATEQAEQKEPEPTAKSHDVTGVSPQVVLDFPPGSFSGLSEADAEEVRAASLLAGLARMREIRAAKGGSDDARAGRGDRE